MKQVARTMKQDRCSGLLALAVSILCVVLLSFAAARAGEQQQAGAESIVRNGELEVADPTNACKPAFWFMPDGLGVQWTNDPESAAHGRCIRLDTAQTEIKMQEKWVELGMTNIWNIPKPEKNAISDTYGLSYDSDIMPVKSGQAYRVTFDYKGAGGGKVWVRCYGESGGERRQRYEKLVFCEKTGGKWVAMSAVLHPTSRKPDTTLMKVMLYAAHPAGLYWFDNIRLEPISSQEYEREKASKK